MHNQTKKEAVSWMLLADMQHEYTEPLGAHEAGTMQSLWIIQA